MRRETLKITRRNFIRYGVAGVVVVAGAVAAGKLSPIFRTGSSAVLHIKLAITEALMEMVDGKLVYHWAFEDLNSAGHLPQMPCPLIQAIEGDSIELSLTNTLPDTHGFRIPGVPGAVGAGIEIAPGETKVLTFAAPAGGSYMYLDHLNAPVNRVLGLHGPMVILPRAGNTPYSSPTPNVQQLFNDLGKSAQFPGEPWIPERTRIWLLNTIDPAFNSMAQKRQTIDPIRFKENFLPRYFTINGLSGAFASHDHHIIPAGRIGQPHLIRILNAGMAADSLHIHVNHVYVLSRVDDQGNNRVQENVFYIDTMTAKPMERMDWLLPFIRPPDIPGDESVPLRTLISQELALTLGGVGQSPLSMPMHDHMEMSQTAAGGNYPQGLVTHWEITGDVDGVDFPNSNPKEGGGSNEEYHGGKG